MRRAGLIVAAAIFLVTHATNLQVPLYGMPTQTASFLPLDARMTTGWVSTFRRAARRAAWLMLLWVWI